MGSLNYMVVLFYFFEELRYCFLSGCTKLYSHNSIQCCLFSLTLVLSCLFDIAMLTLYRNTNDFCMLILYAESSLNSFISTNNFLSYFLGFSLCSVRSYHLLIALLLFLSGYLLFIFLVQYSG